MKLAIIGCGVVGGAISEGFERLGHEVFRHDPVKFGTTIDDVIKSKSSICFICVPTPQNTDGSCNTSIVESVVQELVDREYVGVIAIKSTVEPGFTRKLKAKHVYQDRYWQYKCAKFAFVPEFLREKSAFYDFTEGHDTLVVGTKDKDTFDLIVKAHGKYPKKVIQMTPTEAELVKYFSNVFNALRVTFANGFHDVCKILKADYTVVKNAVVSRDTLKDMYLDVNDNFRGFSGPCLPKDTSAFAALASRLGVDAKIFQTIVEDNRLYEPKVPAGMREK